MVARYDPKVKGHHLLVDTLARHPLRDAVELIFAGAGCDTAEPLRHHLARVGLLNRTKLLGAVPDIERVYSGLDVLVLPSMTEALPMVVLEAAASGVVVCASRVGDVPRLGLPDDVLFEPGDADGLSRALEAAAVRARRPGETERQRALAEGFGIAASARIHAELYRTMLI
jgi:glycosyltransferase involved in cell wall biosynthesis